jgi:hypothetical protein
VASNGDRSGSCKEGHVKSAKWLLATSFCC